MSNVEEDVGGFIVDGDICYAGKHLLIDLYDCENHGTIEEIETVMKNACIATGATILHSHLHPFKGGGVSGAIILAESHMSFHSWVVEKFIALDIFVCGKCDPHLATPILEKFFKPRMTKISLEKRGIQSA
jgi:S-adenosylmethionine decarboxylase